MSDKYCYVAVEPCGCWTGVTVDDGNEQTRKDVRDFMKDGRHIERMTIAEFKAANRFDHEETCEFYRVPPPKQEKLF